MNRTTQDPGEALYCVNPDILLKCGALRKRVTVRGQLLPGEDMHPTRDQFSKRGMNQKPRCSRRLVLLVAVLALGAPIPGAGAGRAKPRTHLIPPDHYYPAPTAKLQGYQDLCEEKLFATPGELARCLVVGGNAGTERAVSVYRKPHPKRADDYWVTVTIASPTGLWEWLQDDPAKRIPREKLKIERHDLRLPASTAQAVHRAWLKMLKGVRKDPKKFINVDGASVIFSASDHGRLLRGQMSGLPEGDVSRLFDIADELAILCVKGSKDPERDLRKIEAMARQVAGDKQGVTNRGQS